MRAIFIAGSIFLASFSSLAEASIWTLTNTPASGTFNGISAPNNDFAIAVGKDGEIVHFVGGDSGTLVPSGTTKELFDVYASSPNLAVATGREIVLLWDGSSWSTLLEGQPDSAFTGAWISPEEDMVIYQSLGTFNIICPYHPGKEDPLFCRASQSPMLAACGDSGDIKMIMADGDIRHLNNFLGDINGPDPLHEQSPPLNLTAVWVPDTACMPGPIAPTELFAIHNTDEFWHFDGSSWSLMEDNIPAEQTLSWLDGTGSGNIVAVGFEPDGGGGNQGVVWHYDGTAWAEDTNLPPGTPGLTDVAANIMFQENVFQSGFEANTGGALLSVGVADNAAGSIPPGVRVRFLSVAERGELMFTSDLAPIVLTDLRMSKKLLTSGPVRKGDRITFQLVIQNIGLGDAVEFLFVDGFTSSSMDLVTQNCEMVQSGVRPGWTYMETAVPILAAGEVMFCTTEFEVTGDPGEEIQNFARVFNLGGETNYLNNIDKVKITISP